MTSDIKNGQLKVWWIPQVPMKPFEVFVDDLKQAKLLLNTLANYDIFQFENKVKPDYSNMGGLVIWDEDLDPDENGDKWSNWNSDDGMEFDEYCEEVLK
jgi:hypothetical protein